jgi:hypothetical protein
MRARAFDVTTPMSVTVDQGGTGAGTGASASSPPRVFDLRTQSEAVRRWNLPARMSMAAAGILCALAGAFVLFAHPVILYNLLATDGIGLFLVTGGLVALAYSFRLRGSSARRVTVDERGITLEYPEFPDGRRVVFQWNRLPGKIILWDVRSQVTRVPHYLERRTGLLWTSPGPVFDLTPETMEAVVDQAKRAGLSVKETMNSQGGAVVEITPAATPPS